MELRQILQTRSAELHARLQVVENRARQFLEYAQAGANMTFTTHGLSHVGALERNYDWLLSRDDMGSLNSTEIFCLLCASFFHDSAMIPARSGDEAAARAQHGERAKPFLMKNRELLGLTIHEVNAISEVIRGHMVERLTDLERETVLGNDMVNIQKLSACLSLADICHADESRAPEIVFRHLDIDEESAQHWRRHLQIGGITRKEDRIVMSAVCFSDQGQRAVEDYKNAIETQLGRVKPYFHSQLSPITGVDLALQRLESEFDVTIRFRANTPAILNMLVEGVYQRNDVFIRELVQNSLDACHLRKARAMRRSEEFLPRIVVSLLSSRGHLKAVRVDDNGLGMDIADIQDTVLWIGNTIADREDIRALLSATTGKNLIATFGIGLLSCFKSGRRILVRTAKENREPIEFEVSSINDAISPSRSRDSGIGSTFLVEIEDENADLHAIRNSIGHYFRRVHQADVRHLELDWGERAQEYTREEILRIASTEAEVIRPLELPGEDDAFCVTELRGDDFSAWLWFEHDPDTKSGLCVGTEEGKITVLSEGVYVTTDDSSDWLPDHLIISSGIVDFASGAVRLPVSRDTVVEDAMRNRKREEISRKSFAMVDELSTLTGSDDKSISDLAVLVLTFLYMKADGSAGERMLKRLDSFCVVERGGERDTTLLSLRQRSPQKVYVEYPQGRWVSDLTTFDGKKLYDKPDDLTTLQSALFRQDGEIVLSAIRADPVTDDKVLEANLLKAYFKFHDIGVVDLASGDVISGKLRSRPLAHYVRQEISNKVKFVEVPGLPKKRGWKVGDETWVNTANESMAFVYDVLQSTDARDDRIRLAATLVDMLACNFEAAFNTVLGLLSKQD